MARTPNKPKAQKKKRKGRLSAESRANKQRLLKIYGKISREFTAINKTLPKQKVVDARSIPPQDIEEEPFYDMDLLYEQLPDGTMYRFNAGEFGQTPIEPKGGYLGKIPYKERRRIISEYIYPKFKDKKLKELRVEEIRAEIRRFLPNPVAQKAKQYRTFTEIREVIRENFGNISPVPTFVGVVKVLPNKTDDGKPDSYYVDFILFDDGGEPVPFDFDPNEIITTKVALSKEEQEERIKRVKRAVSERKKLKKEAKESKPKEEKPKETKPKTPKPKAKKETQDEVKLRLAEMRASEIAKLESWLAQGIIDQPTFVQLLKEIYSKYEKGGLI
jgi:hypothetical protein